MTRLSWHRPRLPAKNSPSCQGSTIIVATDDGISNTAYRVATVAIFLVAIALRLLRTQLPDDTTYPDDVFQILEPAHRLVFGYGYIAWEFVIGLRNWLLPGLLALILSGFSKLGLNQPEAYGPAIIGFSILLSLTPIEVARRSAHLLGGRRAGLLAAAGAAIYPPLLFAAQKITPEIVAGYALAAALLFALKEDRRSALMAGLLCGLVAGLRIHYAPALLFVAWVIFVKRERQRADIGLAFIAGAGVFSLFGVADWLVWGIPFISYVRAIEINILHGVAAQFGEMPFDFYITAFPLGIVLALLAALDWSKTKWLLVPVAIIFFVHSLIGHKEPRFVFAVHALTVTAIAIPLARWIERGAPRRPLAFAVCFCVVFICVASFLRTSQPVALLVADYRAAISELRTEPDMQALAAYGVGRYNFPGAYWLHRNIPIIQESQVPPGGVPSGVTHIIVSARAPAIDGFETVHAYEHLEVRKRIRLIPGASLPPIDWSMPMIFSGDGYRTYPAMQSSIDDPSIER